MNSTNTTVNKTANFLKSLGPGLLWAGAAIGVSHLVQSTRAGAGYGFALVWVVILANLFKYPFFEYGPRYAAATGENLLQGYQRLGKWVLWLFLGLTFATMFTIQAAVTVVTAGLASYVFGGSLSVFKWFVLLLLTCMVILAVGKYSLLDKTIKVVIIALTVTSVWALLAALGGSPTATPAGETVAVAVESIWNGKGVLFMIALMGWMPSAIDISVWSSIWTLEKTKQTGYKPTLKEALLDFNIGYVGTALISLCFLSLGALVIFGSGEVLSDKGPVFAGQFISLYTKNIGPWSKYVISVAALATMFSTTLTCLDAFPRVLQAAFGLIKNRNQDTETEAESRLSYLNWMLIVTFGCVILISILQAGMTFMVDLATTLSFLTAPVLAVINYKVVTGKHMPPDARPGMAMKLLSWGGIVFLIGFSLLFLYVKLF